MCCLIDFCCICFYNKGHLQPLSDSDSDSITYFIKLTSSVPEMCFNQMNDKWLVCNKCCETIDAAYKFRQGCLRSKTRLTDYILQLNQNSNVNVAANIYLTDLNKFYDVKTEYTKENKIEKVLKVNEDTYRNENFAIKPITEIKEENNPNSSKLIDTLHNIQFENVFIKEEQKHQNFEEHVEENVDNLMLNEDNVKFDAKQNDIKLTASAIKNENNYYDLEKHLYEKFDNKKYFNESLTNQNEIKIDIVDHDIDSVNCEMSIQYKGEIIKEFSAENNIIPFKDQEKNNMDTEINFFHKPLEEKKKNISSSTKSKQQKLCGVVNEKVNIVKNLECNICKKTFLKTSSLFGHMRIHTVEKPFECEVCRKNFAQLPHLKKHIKIHTGQKPYECSVCHKKFNYASNLTEHMRIHTGEKPHECDVCQKKFNHSSNLREHKKIHTGERPHECSVCKKKFTQLATLVSHMRIHTGEKPHECNVCQKKFAQLSTFRKHMKIHTD